MSFIGSSGAMFFGILVAALGEGVASLTGLIMAASGFLLALVPFLRLVHEAQQARWARHRLVDQLNAAHVRISVLEARLTNTEATAAENRGLLTDLQNEHEGPLAR